MSIGMTVSRSRMMMSGRRGISTTSVSRCETMKPPAELLAVVIAFSSMRADGRSFLASDLIESLSATC
ncbi:hypothetical protein MOP88_13965 [Sphingomonas sp. WKB10]|nr:hypothetical protein [Sphingomonas sp. WKB10]